MPPVNRSTNTPVALPRNSTPTAHTVKSGDSLSKLARQYGTTVQALVDANKGRYPTLATNPGNIKIGWQLALPGGAAPATNPTPAQQAPKSNDQILLVGMGDHASYEATELKKRANVTFIGDSFADDQVKTGTGASAVTHNLRNAEGIKSFVATLGLPAEQAAKIATAIGTAGTDARDELAQLAAVWARAEKGGLVPARLMLSGHSVGNGVWGDNNGTLSLAALGKLAEAMPNAARQVEDLHISGCYSAGQHSMDTYRAIFPKVKTIWAYTGSAPGSYSGAIAHHARWEAATRGATGALDRAIADNTRKGENVAVWSVEKGYIDGRPPEPLDSVRRDLARAEATFTRHFSGEQAVSDPQTGPLRDYYNELQRLLQHPELPRTERPALEAKRDQTIRLIYYSRTVAPRFAQAHGDAVKKGFEAVGLAAPDFAKLGRSEALGQIAAFEQKVAGLSPVPAQARALLPLLADGLRELSPRVIPDSWV